MTVAAAALSITLSALPVFMLGSLAVLIRRELHFGETQLGATASLYYLASALASVPAGRFVERLGARRGIALAGAGSALAATGVAVAAHSWALLSLFMALAGVANGIALPATNLALARGIRRERQGVAFGFKQSNGPFATLLAGAAVPGIGLTIGWRWAFAFTAMAAVPLVAQGAFRRGALDPPVARDPADVSTAPLVVLAAAAACAVVAGSSLGAFYVESAVHHGLSPGAAGTWLAAGSVTGIGARVYWGSFGDRLHGGYLVVVSALLLGGVAGFALLGAGGAPAVLAAATLLTFVTGWAWPGLFNFAIVRGSPHAPAAATGITGTGQFGGGVVGPIGFGFLVERFSYQTAWLGAATAMLGAAVLVFAGNVLLRRQRAEARQPGAAAPR